MKTVVAWLTGALWLAGAVLGLPALWVLSGAAFAQLALPGAVSDTPEPAKPVERKTRPRRAAPAPVKLAAPDPESLAGKTLRLNGRNGELRLERGDGGALKIVKYTLLGEVVSKPEQQCRIDIVADEPIVAKAKGEPDGLARYGADILACPLTFDVVSDGVLVPAQTNACAFTAADCQASPSGLWGPEAAEIDKDPKAVSKARAAADRSIQDSLREMEKRDKDAAASLAREQNDFAAERDDICREYVAEARLGFCASRLAQSRAALLAKRAAEAGPAPSHAATEHKRRRKREQ